MAEILFHPYYPSQACESQNQSRLREALGISEGDKIDLDKIPFTLEDCTAGTENELQTAVIGSCYDVDLPLSIKNSGFYANLHKRVNSGDMPRSRLLALENYLEANPDQVWENSWVRFPLSYLNSYSSDTLNRDLLSDKSHLKSPERSDIKRFIFDFNGETWLRIPISYLFKIALAEVLSDLKQSQPLFKSGSALMEHYLNDNTSPETFSFYTCRALGNLSLGKNVAAEMGKRFALTQMLLQYANRVFRLPSHGQKAVVYFASNPPVRQNQLNELIPDNFYRELFMSPCLSGWDRGEDKFRYMVMCHQVLSRSQLNAMKKLKEAGIITSNLVVMPNTSNISLANNGTHLSLGSLKLTRLLNDKNPFFSNSLEKWAGDLAIKISEHFLPLFVGTYSAAPQRLDFADFHPEKVLGFLPHELDFTHLRMIWRRWKKKADLKVCGHSLTPFGPEWLDHLLSRVLGLRGDFVPDRRLLDYLVALMSTDQSPALDGNLDNNRKLLQDLESQGVFDASMSLYLLYKLRRHCEIGFSGFEGRFYSLFHNLEEDFGEAADLQMLISALAYKYILEGTVTHRDIPDTPSVESERRQIFFSTAIGLPTFFIRKETPNRFMQKIMQRVQMSRSSTRYSGYLRLYNIEYRKALIKLLREDAGDLIAMMGLTETLAKLEERLFSPGSRSAAGKLSKGILDYSGMRDPLKYKAEEFNQAAESYCRHSLRRQHYEQSLGGLLEDMKKLDQTAMLDTDLRLNLNQTLPENSSAANLFRRYRQELIDDTIGLDNLKNVLQLTILSIAQDQNKFDNSLRSSTHRESNNAAPIH